MVGKVGNRPRTAADAPPFLRARFSNGFAAWMSTGMEHREEGRGGGLGGELGPMVPTQERRKGPRIFRGFQVLGCSGRAWRRLWSFVHLCPDRQVGVVAKGRGWSFFTGKSREQRGPHLLRAGKQTRGDGSGEVWAPGRQSGWPPWASGVGALERVGVPGFSRTCHAALLPWRTESKWLAAKTLAARAGPHRLTRRTSWAPPRQIARDGVPTGHPFYRQVGAPGP
jgi:hypothetical protein